MADDRRTVADIPRPSRVPTTPGRILFDQMLALQARVDQVEAAAQAMLVTCAEIKTTAEAIRRFLEEQDE